MPSWNDAQFEECYPLPFLLRSHCPEAWFRIHSLPESKRYAEDNYERALIRERYSKFGTALLGLESPCIVYQSCFGTRNINKEFWGYPENTWKKFREFQESGGKTDEFWCSWVSETRWTPSKLDDLFDSIASDRVENLVYYSILTGNLFAPYDGGADGFSLNSSLLARIRIEFDPWRSSHPQGL